MNMCDMLDLPNWHECCWSNIVKHDKLHMHMLQQLTHDSETVENFRGKNVIST